MGPHLSGQLNLLKNLYKINFHVSPFNGELNVICFLAGDGEEVFRLRSDANGDFTFAPAIRIFLGEGDINSMESVWVNSASPPNLKIEMTVKRQPIDSIIVTTS